VSIVVGSGAYATYVSNDGATSTYSFYSDWSGNDVGAEISARKFSINYYGIWSYGVHTTAASGIWYTSLAGDPTNIPFDVDVIWTPFLHTLEPADYFGAQRTFRSYALAATTSTPGASSITASSATAECYYTPNTNFSSCSAQFQYKRTVDSTWINFGAPSTFGGSAQVTTGPIALTGLSPSTSYDIRLQITRGTSSNPTTTSVTTTFVTAVGGATVVTNAPALVTNTSANFDATVTLNAATGAQVYWKWDTVNPPVANTSATIPADASAEYQLTQTGLSPGVTYYVQAFVSYVTPAGSPGQGSVVTFTTAPDPGADAAKEDHMLQFDYDRKYGASATVYFTLASPASSTSDRYVTTAPGTLFASGDIKVSKDGAAFANATNTPTQVVAANPLYALALTASEMAAEDVIVQIVDQNGPAFRDALIHVRTKLNLGQINADASALTNANGMTVTGVGTGHGLSCVGGATGLDIDGVLGQMVIRFNTAAAGGASAITLDAGASATTDWYKGSIVSIVGGTGVGQSRLIQSYNGGTKVATVDGAWAANPDNTSLFVISPGSRDWFLSPAAELSSVPAYTDSYGKFLQFVMQRFVYRRTQTANAFTMYKVDDNTPLTVATVSDNGVTENHTRLT
jgi:hypothetical protein